ncbi:MAG: methionine--tRNA ligase subunit beta [bacterium]|nr:methionine--tRNA ligase subunit beta [bacterium]
MINLEDFQKLDLRVVKVIKAEPVLGSAKLLRLDLDLGELGIQQIVSGIAKSYKPEDLVDKEIVIVANLEPRMILGLESQGMLLAVSQADKVVLLVPDQAVSPGAKVS